MPRYLKVLDTDVEGAGNTRSTWTEVESLGLGAGDTGISGTPGVFAIFTDTDTVGDSSVSETEGPTLLTAAIALRPTTNYGCSLGITSRRFANLYVQTIISEGLQVDGPVTLNSLPTSDPGVAGQLWNNLGVLMVSAG